MKKIFLLITFLLPLFAVDYTEMSTQELIAIMGYVSKENEKKLSKELKTRVKYMTEKEKEAYEKNLKKFIQKK